MQMQRSQIRKTVRAKRNALSSLAQTIAAQDIVEQIQKLPQFQSAQNIALYLSADGELDTHPLIELCWSRNKNVYLPVLHPFSAGHLLFIHYTHETKMVENRFNIQEPQLDKTKVLPINQLDIIFTPLVAFDSTGQRLGMGGGYYDCSLEKWYKTGKGALPIGIAHDCQQVNMIPSEKWDIPLPTIVTPSKVWSWE